MKTSGIFYALSVLIIIFGLTFSGHDRLFAPFEFTKSYKTFNYIIQYEGHTIGSEKLYIKHSDQAFLYITERKLPFESYPAEINVTLKLNHQRRVVRYEKERRYQGICDIATLERNSQAGWQYFRTNEVQEVTYINDINLDPDFIPLDEDFINLYQCLVDRYDFIQAGTQQCFIFTDGIEQRASLYYYAPILFCQLPGGRIVEIESDEMHQIKNITFPNEIYIKRVNQLPAQQNQHREYRSPKYDSEKVSFQSRDGTILLGQLVLPQNSRPAPGLVLISGTGPNSYRECGILSAIAHRLGEMGIATLSYNKRGVLQSGGDYLKHTHDELIDDAEGALLYLCSRSEIDASKVGLLGHSEGGIIAPAVASRQKKAKACFVMASPAVRIYPELAKIQTINIGRIEGVSEEIIKERVEDIEQTARKLQNETTDWWRYGNRIGYMGWFRSLMKHSPKSAFSRLSKKMPVILFQGEKDIYIPPQHGRMIIGYLNESGHLKHDLILFPNLNHNFGRMIMLPECLPYNEFVEVDEEFLAKLSEKVLETFTNLDVTDYIAFSKQTKNNLN